MSKLLVKLSSKIHSTLTSSGWAQVHRHGQLGQQEDAMRAQVSHLSATSNHGAVDVEPVSIRGRLRDGHV